MQEFSIFIAPLLFMFFGLVTYLESDLPHRRLGYRVLSVKQTVETWRVSNKFAAKLLLIVGGILLVIGVILIEVCFCLKKKRNIFLVILIPVLLFTTNIGSLLQYAGGQNVVFAANSDTVNGSINNDTMKNNFYLNFELKEGVNKNISVQKISENETNILVNDI